MRLTLLLVKQQRRPTDIAVRVVENLIQRLWAYPIYFLPVAVLSQFSASGEIL